MIVCKDSEERTIVSLLNQIGWKSRIQSIITQSHLEGWYEKALRGSFRHILGERLIQILIEEIKYEFPSSDNNDLVSFMKDRGYTLLSDPFWSTSTVHYANKHLILRSHADRRCNFQSL